MKVGYARVSTDKAEQDQSVDAQVQALRAAGCQKILQERRSAFKGKRKQWEAAKDLIQSGKVTHFMVCSLSRGSRQGENKEMSRLCKANGVEFIILDGTQSDVTTPEGLLMVSIFDAVNEADSLIKGMAVKRWPCCPTCSWCHRPWQVPIWLQVQRHPSRSQTPKPGTKPSGYGNCCAITNTSRCVYSGRIQSFRSVNLACGSGLPIRC